MPFNFIPLRLEGLVLIQPKVLQDKRGFFMETYRKSDFEKAGIKAFFLQDNHSRSCRGTLRGLHFQSEPHAQGKLVRVISGSVWDVAVDIRKGSTTFLKWEAVELSGENRRMLYLPAGFAHGFLALEDGTEFLYKCTAEYHRESERGIRWNDPTLAIPWPLKEVLVSRKDQELPFVESIGS